MTWLRRLRRASGWVAPGSLVVAGLLSTGLAGPGGPPPTVDVELRTSAGPLPAAGPYEVDVEVTNLGDTTLEVPVDGFRVRTTSGDEVEAEPATGSGDRLVALAGTTARAKLSFDLPPATYSVTLTLDDDQLARPITVSWEAPADPEAV